ncbi:MAG: BatA and WFA domain-containing protein [Flavobacteriaceae bacterium]|nr:BatA and WFA domain-containing protein [Flavobacteriaceae bacterium]
MQFNQPEVLYALFLLIIPVIIHLFQLRKFQTENFTNVKFLKKLSQQTRKSSRLKKWLVLATRLLILTSIIFAFAQPYFPSETPAAENIETVIYLDNSYSMQATGQRGRLLERSIQELLENLPDDRDFTLFTNTDEFKSAGKSDLQKIGYSVSQLDFETVLLKAKNIFSNDPTTHKKLLLISDFQEKFKFPKIFNSEDITLYPLARRPERLENIQLDSAFITGKSIDTRILNVQLSYSGNQPENTPVSLYSGDNLIGKTSIDFSEKKLQQLEFPLENKPILNGLIKIEDNGLQFDNNLFFTINEANPILISSINNAEDGFLNRIFTSPEFEYRAMPVNAIDYNKLAASQVVVLNEVAELSGSLLSSLQKKYEENVVFIVIPSAEDTDQNYRLFMRRLGVSGFENKQEQEKLVTGISFKHPLFTGVFEEQIRNFEYPKVQVTFLLKSGNIPILSFQDEKAFLFDLDGNYFFTAPLNQKNTNFTQSPLVVPTFYNIGASAIRPVQLYYYPGKINKIEVPVEIQGDQILQISSETSNFIPQQKRFSNKVEIIIDELPNEPGNFSINNKEQLVSGISFNVDRDESKLVYKEIKNAENIEIIKELPEFFNSAGFKKEVGTFWKWFVTFALLFLIIETLLLKYFK